MEALNYTITGVFGLLNIYLGWRLNQKVKEKKKAEDEGRKLKAELKALTLFFDYEFYSLINDQADEIFETTKADRMLLLFAVNGREDFNHATAVFEKREDVEKMGAGYRYNMIEIDAEYRKMLKDVERERSTTIDVSVMNKDSLLYKIYSSDFENVKHSIIKFIARKQIDENNDILIYTSIATSSEEPFTESEKLRIRLLTDTIRGRAATIKIGYKNEGDNN